MTIDTVVLEQYLKTNLDKEGLARLMAVELTVEFFKTRQTADDQKYFQQTYEKIYNNLLNKKEDGK